MITRKELFDKMADFEQCQIAEADEWKAFINQPPHEDWLEKNKSAGTKYMPIEKQEWMANYIFPEWWTEIKNIALILNSLVVHVTTHYKHPITNEWKKSDGCGAWPIQLDAGSKASNLENIKAMAIQMNLPAAFSMAKGNSLEQIGKCFGGGINRKNAMYYDQQYEPTGGQYTPGETQTNKVTSMVHETGPEVIVPPKSSVEAVPVANKLFTKKTVKIQL